MLTAEQYAEAWASIERADAAYFATHGRDAWRRVELANVLRGTLLLYTDAEREGDRLDCLTTAVRALTGALRERLYGAGEARDG